MREGYVRAAGRRSQVTLPHARRSWCFGYVRAAGRSPYVKLLSPMIDIEKDTVLDTSFELFSEKDGEEFVVEPDLEYETVVDAVEEEETETLASQPTPVLVEETLLEVEETMICDRFSPSAVLRDLPCCSCHIIAVQLPF